MRVLTVGTFDILHPGHLWLFTDCRRLAGASGEVVAGVNTDAFVKRYRGVAPTMPCESRVALVGALRNVDRVVHNHQPDGSMLGLIDIVQPAYLVIGSDWLERDYLGQIGVTAREIASRDISLVFSPRRAGGPTSSALKAAM